MTHHHRFPLQAWLCLAVAGLSAFGGCSRNPLGRLPVSGKVVFDGKPLEKGTIDFRPVPGNNSVSSGAAIAVGVYAIPAIQGLPPGTYEVRIFSSRDVAPLPSPDGAPGNQPPAIELIPPQYNVRTQQVVEIVARQANVFNFDIPAPVPSPPGDRVQGLP